MKRKKPIKLYLAILNKGWIRSEIVNTIYVAGRTPGVNLVLEPPAISWAMPNASNRCVITQRFLKTDSDFLLMIDDDVIPMHNVAEMVFFNKDIVGSPTRRRHNQRLEWVAYAKHPSLEYKYASIDFDKVNPNSDLLKVDAIGTGCILIKRRVLEKMKAPFEDLFDKDGIRKLGQDLNFCRKALEAGFEVFTCPKRVSEHIREAGLVSIDGCFISRAADEAQTKYGFPWGMSDIVKKDWDFIQNIIQDETVKTVLEFGSGISTLLMSESTRVDSFETNKDQIEQIKAKLQNGKATNFYSWDGKEIDVERLRKRKYDLAFINGSGSGNEVAMKIASQRAKRIVVHNAARLNEGTLQEKYLKKDFWLVSRNGWHENRCHYWRRKDA